MLCLLIDDDPDDHEIFQMALQGISDTIICKVAKDAMDGLQKLAVGQSFIPDYIFLDVNMHRMNGIQCLAEIKKLDHLKEVPVIMLSTSLDTKITEQCRQLGASGFVVKPAGLTALENALRKVFKF